MDNNNSRRTFLKTLALSLGALLLAPMVKLQQAVAAMVDPTKDITAKALKYTADVDATKPPLAGRKAGDYCKYCVYYGDATGKAETAKCQIIQSGEVAGKGWCSSYSARPGMKHAPEKAAKKKA